MPTNLYFTQQYADRVTDKFTVMLFQPNKRSSSTLAYTSDHDSAAGLACAASEAAYQ